MKIDLRIISVFLGLCLLAPFPSFSAIKKIAKPLPSPYAKRPLVVVLDPGHGGKDTGAIGKRKTQEKKIALSIAYFLKAMLESTPGIKVYMTRTNDTFIPLRKRLMIARHYKADIFISLHADAYRNSLAKGASIFALSQRGATSESARWVAEAENEAENLGETNLNNKDPLLKSVLIDMSQTATINASLKLGQIILKQFKKLTYLHSSKVEQAAFVVLKSPDIPSILIENGYISNLQEEKQLNDPAYQRKLASAIKSGILLYFKSS